MSDHTHADPDNSGACITCGMTAREIVLSDEIERLTQERDDLLAAVARIADDVCGLNDLHRGDIGAALRALAEPRKP